MSHIFKQQGVEWNARILIDLNQEPADHSYLIGMRVFINGLMWHKWGFIFNHIWEMPWNRIFEGSFYECKNQVFLTLCIFLRYLHLSEDSFLFNFELVFQTCNKMKSKTAIKDRYETYQLPEFNFMTSNYVNNVSFSSSESSYSSSSLLCAFHQTRCD